MDEVLAPSYYRHDSPHGIGYARVQEGAGPFLILTTGEWVYACPTREAVRITQEEYESGTCLKKVVDVIRKQQ